MTQRNDADPTTGIAAWRWWKIVNGTTDTAIITTWKCDQLEQECSEPSRWDEPEMLGRSLPYIC